VSEGAIQKREIASRSRRFGLTLERH